MVHAHKLGLSLFSIIFRFVYQSGTSIKFEFITLYGPIIIFGFFSYDFRLLLTDIHEVTLSTHLFQSIGKNYFLSGILEKLLQRHPAPLLITEEIRHTTIDLADMRLRIADIYGRRRV